MSAARLESDAGRPLFLCRERIPATDAWTSHPSDAKSFERYFSSNLYRNHLFVITNKDHLVIAGASRGSQEIHHADLGKHQAAVSAGILEIDHREKHIKIDNISGSYYPDKLSALANSLLKFAGTGLFEYAASHDFLIKISFCTCTDAPPYISSEQDVTEHFRTILAYTPEKALSSYAKGEGDYFTIPTKTIVSTIEPGKALPFFDAAVFNQGTTTLSIEDTSIPPPENKHLLA